MQRDALTHPRVDGPIICKQWLSSCAVVKSPAVGTGMGN